MVAKNISEKKATPPFVISATPSNGQEIVLYSMLKRGIDVVIPRPKVEARWTLGGYVKYTVEGQTDKGGFAHLVVRTAESNEDELQVLDLKFF